MNILVPVAVMSFTGMVLGIMIAFVSKKFETVTDPKIDKLVSALPGINCGACGYPGCMAYAKAVGSGEAPANLCVPGGEETMKNLSAILGIATMEVEDKKTARVMCGGDNSKSNRKYNLSTTIKSCASANLYFAGDKSCGYGCLGYGDCERICPFDAIKVNDKGIAVVDSSKCTGCWKCVTACPKHIIKMVPVNNMVSVYCMSKDKGSISGTICDVSCVACGICEKACPESAITIDNNLAVIDPKKCTNCGLCELKCPTNAIPSDVKELEMAKIIEEKCIGCGICKKVCPVNAVSGEIKQKHFIIEEKCIGCEKCFEKCPVKAIEMETIIKKT